jgi:ubiquinone/menaquinone biosynthesis C-methylase UbiE
MNHSLPIAPLTDPTKTCIVCGGHDFATLYSVTDTNQGVPGQWDILQCKSCGNGVLSPYPDADVIGSFYRDYFYTDEGKRFRGWMEVLREKAAALRGRNLNKLKPQRGRLMDFGSGAGHFASAQRAAGWEVHAVDPYSAASTNAEYCRLTDISFELLYPDNHFDVVTLWYVIEHLRHPRAALAEFRRVLKDDGVLLLAQQDFGSLQAKIFGPHWLYLDPPRHLWQFSASSLTTLAENVGFKVIHTQWSSLEMAPFCMLQSAYNMLLGNHNDLFRFLKNRKLPKSMKDGSVARPRPWATAASIALLPVMVPLIVLLYFMGLLFKQGDIFTLYLKKT